MLINVFAAVKLTTTGGRFQLSLVAKMSLLIAQFV